MASRARFNWKVVEPYDGAAAEDWVSWDDVGMAESVEWKHRVVWRNCADISHAWTGMVSLLPGQQEPYHTHGHPMFYFILQVHQYISASFQWSCLSELLITSAYSQGTPIVKLNGIRNRVKKWQCVSIPSLCPHGIYNDTEEECVVLWCYVSNKDKVGFISV